MTSRRKFLGGSVAATLGLVIPSRANAQTKAVNKGTKVCKKSAISVGGGKIFSTRKGPILVTQPKKGLFRAFSAMCTHEGCTIGPFGSSTNVVVGGVVSCGCHGAAFNPSTGAVVRGPAQTALGKYTVSTDKTYIYI